VDIDKVFLKKKECSAGFICADIVVIIGLKHKRGYRTNPAFQEYK